jgi:hypothetical protein
MWLCLQLCFQNGSVSNEEFSAVSVLARLGVAVDAYGGFVRERQVSLLSGGTGINHKENVMEEPKEEDEKKMTEVRVPATYCCATVPIFSLSLVVYHCSVQYNQFEVKNFSFYILQLL